VTLGRFLAVALVGVVVALAVALVVQRGQDPGRAAQPRQRASAPRELRLESYARAVAANYKVLSPRQSRRLLAYARSLSACLRRHGVAVGAPRVTPTRIRLTVSRGQERAEVLAQGVACGEALGGPPPGASQQFRPAAHAILIYLPKYCLLDPKVARDVAG